jgi:predicted transcriptional regulator
MTATATPCVNPMCSCDPCGCGGDCRCGVARLGDLERLVMDIVWEEPGRELTGRDVANVLPRYAYTTVATVLDRLVHKGLLSRRVERGKIRFTAIGTDGAHTAVLMYESLTRAGDSQAALVRFAETLSPSEADVLRRALNRSRSTPRPAKRQ